MIKIFNQYIINSQKVPTNNQSSNNNLLSKNNSISTDSFTKLTAPIHFNGTNKKNDTSNGRFLKGLKNITDPYSGIKLLTFQEMEQISHDLSQINNSQKKIKY